MVIGTRATMAAVLALAALAGTACTGEQDPGVVDQPGPAETSDTLGQCPPDGPDATTPPAGCLDPDGRVVRP